MRHLFKEFVNDIHKDADKKHSQVREMDVNISNDVKIPAVALFDQLGSLFDKELKQRITNGKKNSQKRENQNKTVEQHLLIDDH